MGEQDFKREEADRAFEHLYRRHRVDVYRAAMRRTHDHHEAEDVTQSAFLDAYRAVLRGAEPELPRAWLLAIAENVRRRRFATALRRPRTTPLDHDVTASTSPDQVRIEEIREALAQLPANQRSAFVLREVGGLSYAEIASRLDVSVPAVQMLLFRARQSLRAVLAPSLGRLPGLLAPHWLVGLAARLESASVGARSLGTVGARCLPAVGTAAVAAVAGVATVSAVSGSRPPVSHEAAAPAAHASIPPRLAGVAWARPTAARAEPTAFGPRVARRPVTPAVRKQPVSPSVAPAAPAPTATAAAPTPAVTSAPGPQPTAVDAAPAAPSPAAPTAASGDGERSAPALIPLPTTIGPVELPVQITLPVSLPIPVTLPVPVALPPTVPLPIQVTQPLPVTVQLPVSVPVVEAPSVEVPEVPTLELPTLPVLPVEVGGALPVLLGP